MPGSTTNSWSRSVLMSTTRISPRYPESINPGALTTPMPWRAARPEARLHEPRMPFRDLDRDADRDHGALTRSGDRPLAGGEIEPASPSYAVVVGGRRGEVAEPERRSPSRHPLEGLLARRPRGSGRSAPLRHAEGARGCEHPRRRGARRSVRPGDCSSAASARPSDTARAVERPRTDPRTQLGDPASTHRALRPFEPRSAAPSDRHARPAGGPADRRVDLVRRARPGCCPPRSPRARR